jgi:hypothetical protein
MKGKRVLESIKLFEQALQEKVKELICIKRGLETLRKQLPSFVVSDWRIKHYIKASFGTAYNFSSISSLFELMLNWGRKHACQ